MAILINRKICDNTPDCGAIAACPTRALFWSREKETIEIDNSLCINCYTCKTSVP